MAWTPIADAGVYFSFNPVFGSPTISGSTITATMQPGPAWDLEVGEPSDDISLRVTIQAYSSVAEFGEDPSAFEFERPDASVDVVQNTNSGTSAAFAPNPVLGHGNLVRYSPGSGSETTRDESYTMFVEVETPEPPDTCQEHGRTTRAYVSGYTLDRVHVVRAARTQRRCLVANFNGAIGPGRKVVKATWRATAPWVTIMASGSLSPDGREARVNVTMANCGLGHIKCLAELDNGEIYTQVYELRVVDAPYFAEPYQAPGPYELTVLA